MQLIQQNEAVQAERDVKVAMLSEDGQFATGLSLSVAIQKPGLATFSPIAGTVQEAQYGSYVIHLAQADVDTCGHCQIRITATGAMTQMREFQVTRIPGEVHGVAARHTNLRKFNKSTGVMQVYDDDGVTLLQTHTPVDDGTHITIGAS